LEFQKDFARENKRKEKPGLRIGGKGKYFGTRIQNWQPLKIRKVLKKKKCRLKGKTSSVIGRKKGTSVF